MTEPTTIDVKRGRPELTIEDGPGKGTWLKLSWLVEQACAGAVVGYLPLLQTCRSDIQCDECDLIGDSRMCDPPPIPIACAGFPGLAGDVARKLLARISCETCSEDPCHSNPVAECEQPPFTAAYAEVTTDGERWREWVLVSAPCKTCGGDGASNGDVRIPGGCRACGGTGAAINTKAVAARYSNGPETADNTAREARFRVMAR
jgi:hypothetical protein